MHLLTLCQRGKMFITFKKRRVEGISQLWMTAAHRYLKSLMYKRFSPAVPECIVALFLPLFNKTDYSLLKSTIMKKLLYLLTLGLFVTACGNDTAKTEPENMPDSVSTPQVNEMDNPNRTPGSNMPGQAMGNGDTASYEGMPNKVDSSRH